MWCKQYKSKKSTLSHETKVQFRQLAVYHIFHNTDTYSLFSLYKRGGIESEALKQTNKFEKKLEKNFWKKNFEKKINKKKFWEKSFGKKILKQKFWEKN